MAEEKDHVSVSYLAVDGLVVFVRLHHSESTDAAYCCRWSYLLCVSLCWSLLWALQIQWNRLKCGLGDWRTWLKEPCIRWGS